MKLEIYNEQKAPKEKTLIFRLLSRRGRLILACVDENGESLSYLVSITTGGYLERHRAIQSGLGLRLNGSGILLDEEEEE